jgi:hypothetical protein
MRRKHACMADECQVVRRRTMRASTDLREDTATEEARALVKRADLPGGEGALGYGKDNFGGAVVASGEIDRNARGTVTRTGFDARLGGKLGAGGAEVGEDRATGVEAFGVGPVVADDEFVRGHALVDHDIGGVRLGRGDADTAALSERVVVQSAMFAEHAAGEIDDGAGFFGEIFFEEILHAHFADEADALAVFFLRGGESGGGGFGPHFAFEQFTNRKRSMARK